MLRSIYGGRLLPGALAAVFGGCGLLAATAVADTRVELSIIGSGTVKETTSAHRIDCTKSWADPDSCGAFSWPGWWDVVLAATEPYGWDFVGWDDGGAGLGCSNTTRRCSFRSSATHVDANLVAQFRDILRPTATFTGGPGQDSVNLNDSRSATFSFSTDQDPEIRGFQCELDGTALASCTSPLVLTNLSDGFHTLTIGATDSIGYGAQVTRRWDQQVPAVAEIRSGPTGFTSSTFATFALETNKGIMQCRLIRIGPDGRPLDAPPFEGCSSPKTYTRLSEGSHRFEVQAIFTSSDGVSRPGAITTRAFTVDTVPPETRVVGGPAEGLLTNASSATFSLDSTEPGSSFRCSLDGAPSRCGATVAFNALRTGTHTFRAAAIDRAGNVDPTPAVRSFGVTYDRDGDWALVNGTPPDCDDEDPARRPGAVDIVRNGVDEDCDGEDADYPPITSPVRLLARRKGRYTVIRRLSVMRPQGGSPAGPLPRRRMQVPQTAAGCRTEDEGAGPSRVLPQGEAAYRYRH